MFEENEDLVEEETTENVEEQTTEENVQEESIDNVDNTEEIDKEQEKTITFTKDEVNEMVAKRSARIEAKLRREFEKKYGRAENVLKAGLQKDNLEDAVSELETYYKNEGVNIPTYNPDFNHYDMEAGAEKEANSIIESGYDDVVEEVDRLANIGVDNMSPREKIVFRKLADYRQSAEKRQELSSIGVKAEVIDSKEFKDFASQFNSNTSMKKVYELYTKTLPKEPVEKIGSMKNGNTQEEKTYYTPDEVDKLTSEELDDPVIFKRVHESMQKWK